MNADAQSWRFYGPALRQWYDSLQGQLVLAEERKALDRVIPDLFGYHLLQVGDCGQDVLGTSRILHRMVMGVDARCDRATGVSLCAHPEQLPFQSDSLDAILLYHALEFSPDPHQVLREVERCLVPEGHVVILGFDPRSLWGGWRMLRRRSHLPWTGRFLSPSRLRDWLSLLDFSPIGMESVYYRPPVRRLQLAERLQFMERWGRRWWPLPGAVYLMTARKNVAGLTPIRPRWRPRRSLLAGFSEPASRNIQSRRREQG